MQGLPSFQSGKRTKRTKSELMMRASVVFMNEGLMNIVRSTYSPTAAERAALNQTNDPVTAYNVWAAAERAALNQTNDPVTAYNVWAAAVIKRDYPEESHRF